LPEPPHALVLEMSASAQEVVALLQRSRILCDRLGELRDAGVDGTLVHGDLRWDNCLAVAAPGSERRTRVLMIDWELAGSGAAEFDVGTVLAEYLRAWVTSIPIVNPADPGRLVDRARRPLATMQPAVQSFWSAYRLARGSRPRLRRVMEFAAVRLIQSAIERSQRLVAPSPDVITLVQLAENLLSEPEEAAFTLLAIGD
jgi:aminoglycoside phosphotransferase (APT) family kinase protein